MITTKTKRKIIVMKVLVTNFERFIPIDIKLPANVKTITGITATASAL